MRFPHPLLARLGRVGVVLAALYGVLVAASLAFPVGPRERWVGRRVWEGAAARPTARAAAEYVVRDELGTLLVGHVAPVLLWLLSAAVLRQAATGRVRWSGAAWLPGAGAVGGWLAVLCLGFAVADWAAPGRMRQVNGCGGWVGLRVKRWLFPPGGVEVGRPTPCLVGLSGGGTARVLASPPPAKPLALRALDAARLEGSMLLGAACLPATLLGLAGTVHCLRPPGNEP